MSNKRFENLAGKRFGKLLVVSVTELRKNGYCVWKCACDCGGTILASSRDLKRGSVNNCGCVPKNTARRGNKAEDLTGQVFGSLTVIRRLPNRNGRTNWLCQCECGNLKEIYARDLKDGSVKSCGCGIGISRYTVDITGNRYGRIKVLRPTEKRTKSGSVIYMCRCDCGNIFEASHNELVYGGYKSCGCLKKEHSSVIYKELHRIDGSCIEFIRNRGMRVDNKSGYIGVYVRGKNCFSASIGFKGKQFYLGTYTTIEQAAKVRNEAKKIIHDGFLDAYGAWKEYNKELTEDFNEREEKTYSVPLIYDVGVNKGMIAIHTNYVAERKSICNDATTHIYCI